MRWQVETFCIYCLLQTTHICTSRRKIETRDIYSKLFSIFLPPPPAICRKYAFCVILTYNKRIIKVLRSESG